MLLGISPLLTGNLLQQLDAMGHGDTVVVCDGHFPAARLAPIVIDLPGIDAPSVVLAVREVLPLDAPVSVTLMDHDRDPTSISLAAALRTSVELDKVRVLDRDSFYAAAGTARVAIRTGEVRPFGNAILHKGVVPTAEVKTNLRGAGTGVAALATMTHGLGATLRPPLSDLALERGLHAADAAMSIESAAITRTRAEVWEALPAAIRLIHGSAGRVIVSGLGKSGHIGAKMAATMASTGTPAQFVHATEALHGDSGMATGDDVAILISYSGETAEVCQFARMLKDAGVPVIAMTGRPSSTLAGLAEVQLSIEVDREADPLNLAPTASTASTLALGDGLAAALMAISGFGADDFARRHPGGSLGARLAAPADGRRA